VRPARGRVRDRLAQRWTAYGRALRPSDELRRILGHASRTRVSSSVVAAQLAFSLRHPSGDALPVALAREIASLEATEGVPVTWLVHERPTGRTIVHEIDARGALMSVVKLGNSSDDALVHEALVLGALRQGPARPDPVLPTPLGFAQTATRCALRTRLDLSGIARPPYRWDDRTLEAARRAIESIQEQLALVPSELLGSGADGERSDRRTPSHGDFTAWNVFLLARPNGPRLAVIDYEESGFQAEWWDSARLLVTLVEERRVRPEHVARAARRLGVGSDAALAYIDVQLGGADRDLHAGRRARLESYRSSIRGQEW